jgi:hypothetical protein
MLVWNSPARPQPAQSDCTYKAQSRMTEHMNTPPKGNIFPIDARVFFYLFCFVIDVFSPIHFSSPKNYPFPLFFSLQLKIKKTPQFVSPQLILCFWQSLI